MNGIANQGFTAILSEIYQVVQEDSLLFDDSKVVHQRNMTFLTTNINNTLPELVDLLEMYVIVA
jgi:hypothetical protein